jgi:two-component system cell cycle response regulator DivK
MMHEPTAQTPLVLIVEDDPHSRRVAVLTLERAGFRCVAADCADAALVALGRERPSIVLMDLNLPGLDGLELTRWIKNDPSTREIPVMAVTAYALDDDADIARAAGCTGYIAKPYDPAALVEEVKRLVLGTPPHP